MRILFHAPGLAAFRPAAPLPHLLGVQPSVVDRLDDLRASHRLTGNRGNIIHAEAPARTFHKSATGSAYGNIAVLQQTLGAQYATQIARHFDLIVISMANFIRPDHDGAALVAALRPLVDVVPHIVLGCGIQGSHRLSDMMPGNIALIAHFNSHAALFGVRGEKTANWLAGNGFGNATVLGCPSLYTFPRSILGIDGAAARARGGQADVMTAGHLTVHRGRIVPRGLELARAFRGIRASYVFQDEFFTYDELTGLSGLYQEAASEVAAGPVNEWLTRRMRCPVDFQRYYYFSEASAWRQAALRHDVFIGDRFHGGVAALQAGRPAIFLSHDNRVSELTGHFGLPSLTTEEFARRGLARTLDEFLAPDRLEAMKSLYRRRYAEYCAALRPFGVRPEAPLDEPGPVAASPTPAPAISTTRPVPGAVRILERRPYILRMVPNDQAQALVVTFEAADTTIDRRDRRRAGFGEEFLLKNGYAVLSVLTDSANWYRPRALLDALREPELRSFMDRFAEVHSYGSSMGGFGALAFADLLGVSRAVTLQPISTLAADLVPWERRFAHGRALDWSGDHRDACNGIATPRAIYAFYDPATDDARHVARIADAAGDRLHHVTVPGAEHAVPRHLRQRGVLGPAVLAALTGAPAEEIGAIIRGDAHAPDAARRGRTA